MDNNIWKSISPSSLIIIHHDMAIQSSNISFMPKIASRCGFRMLTLLIAHFDQQARTANIQYWLSELEVIG